MILRLRKIVVALPACSIVVAYLNREKRRILGFIYTELLLLTTLGSTPCSHTQSPRVRLNADQRLAEQRAPPELTTRPTTAALLRDQPQASSPGPCSSQRAPRRLHVPLQPPSFPHPASSSAAGGARGCGAPQPSWPGPAGSGPARPGWPCRLPQPAPSSAAPPEVTPPRTAGSASSKLLPWQRWWHFRVVAALRAYPQRPPPHTHQIPSGSGLQRPTWSLGGWDTGGHRWGRFGAVFRQTQSRAPAESCPSMGSHSLGCFWQGRGCSWRVFFS